LKCNFSGTNLSNPLKSIFLCNKYSTNNPLRNVFVITDGQINSYEYCNTLIRNNSNHALRLFTFGVGDNTTKHTIRSLARVGAGAFEFIISKQKSKTESKVLRQFTRSKQPSLSDININWEIYRDETVLQAPHQIVSLFNGERQIIYGYVDNCKIATLNAKVGTNELSTVVSTHDLSFTKGLILHQLAARSMIRDYDDGSYDKDAIKHEVIKRTKKPELIQLSIKYSIVTQWTSFVAIEERDERDALKPIQQPNIMDLITQENVDELSYITFEVSNKNIARTETELLSGDSVSISSSDGSDFIDQAIDDDVSDDDDEPHDDEKEEEGDGAGGEEEDKPIIQQKMATLGKRSGFAQRRGRGRGMSKFEDRAGSIAQIIPDEKKRKD